MKNKALQWLKEWAEKGLFKIDVSMAKDQPDPNHTKFDVHVTILDTRIKVWSN